MNSIDTELTSLHARIAELEKMKTMPLQPKKTASELLEERLQKAITDQHRKNESPVVTACRYSRRSENEMLEAIVESLNRIHARLDKLEKTM